MKRYIQIMLIALVAQFGLSNVVYGMRIAPTTLGDDAIVNSIKQYSDLTEADVNQWKLLWLGNIGTVGAFVAGAISTLGVGAKSYQYAGTVQNITPNAVPSWMTNTLVLTGLGSAGAGYTSYKFLYPRMKAGVLDKAQKFIDICRAIENDSPYRQSIVNFQFGNFEELKHGYLPRLWQSATDMAVYNALANLAQQGRVAHALLNQIGVNDAEVGNNSRIIEDYLKALAYNEKQYANHVLTREVQRKKQEQDAIEREKYEKERRNLQMADLRANTDAKQAGARLMQVKATESYLQMITNTTINFWNGLNYLYKNKEKIVYRGTILGGALYGAYVAAKAKLGYAQ